MVWGPPTLRGHSAACPGVLSSDHQEVRTAVTCCPWTFWAVREADQGFQDRAGMSTERKGSLKDPHCSSEGHLPMVMPNSLCYAPSIELAVETTLEHMGGLWCPWPSRMNTSKNPAVLHSRWGCKVVNQGKLLPAAKEQGQRAGGLASLGPQQGLRSARSRK